MSKLCIPYLKNIVKHRYFLIAPFWIHPRRILTSSHVAACYKSFSYFAHSHCPNTLKWRRGALLILSKSSLSTLANLSFTRETYFFFPLSYGSFVISHAASQFSCIFPNIRQNFTPSLFFSPLLPCLIITTCFWHRSVCLKPYDSESFHPLNNTAPPNVVSGEEESSSHLVPLRGRETKTEREWKVREWRKK